MLLYYFLTMGCCWLFHLIHVFFVELSIFLKYSHCIFPVDNYNCSCCCSDVVTFGRPLNYFNNINVVLIQEVYGALDEKTFKNHPPNSNWHLCRVNSCADPFTFHFFLLQTANVSQVMCMWNSEQ